MLGGERRRSVKGLGKRETGITQDTATKTVPYVPSSIYAYIS